MKNITLLIGVLLVFTGCHNKSYYEVMNVNQQRYGGQQLEDARFLNESYDLVLLVAGMSVIAKKRSSLKETYLLAEEAAKISKGHSFSYKSVALRHRAKLTTVLSKTNDAYLHQLDDVSDENFDAVYRQYMIAKLRELDLKMESYVKEGANERLVELADEVQDSFRSVIKGFNQVQ